ncbi:nucleotidyltransferase domain-containing protein [Streptomyces silvisoli]|uniref:Amino acid transporter n=1 Tax=Streptomyces silvisoli TaxID=3034235 RepID=A0ABT5ZJW6_9ACTN|nr:amino acid transporter [Streptomyces silvisoli]MDF3290119.1 amino acid transporter [Streptomyces silvisoli]
MSSNSLGAWRPALPQEIAEVFQGVDFPWWIAGGYAIELAVGRELRPHADLDVLVLRRDHQLVRRLLADWDLYVADPPGVGQLRPWPVDEVLQRHLHDVWCRRTPDSPWSVQLMLDEAEGDEWVSRRCPRVRRSLSQLGRVTAAGVPYLAPEVQLFYKAKQTREKDEIDFDAMLPLLEPAERAWLLQALDATAPEHPWKSRLLPSIEGQLS